ncbi:DUF3632 domain-containing protein [Aspergillus lucknowensis]|uniref:Uncharacterized protein n=1 Tax=Aspergillus lucknowensis TaxID=176173 RepID=A0ABR4M2H2_9EURO
MVDITDEIFASRLAILDNLFADKISAPSAAEQLSSASLSDSTLEGGLGRLWNLIIALASKSAEQHDKLVDVVVDISELPDAQTPEGAPLTLHDMQVWKDLPTLGWMFRDKWNFTINPNDNPEKKKQSIQRFINMNRFAALLMATDEPVFTSFSWFALVTFREALETPVEQLSARELLDALIPAAAAWIELLGVEIHEWDEEFPSGGKHGAPGRGGPLWSGSHAFSKERWRLWRERFGVVSGLDGVAEEVRKVAGEAEVMMREIEAGDVE